MRFMFSMKVLMNFGCALIHQLQPYVIFSLFKSFSRFVISILNVLQNMKTSLLVPETVITAINSQNNNDKGLISHDFIQFSYTYKVTYQTLFKHWQEACNTGIYTELILYTGIWPNGNCSLPMHASQGHSTKQYKNYFRW